LTWYTRTRKALYASMTSSELIVSIHQSKTTNRDC
jgi:hypothetical protein